jgi:prepilin-type N-terminal cleavage/methylation domain-containing protein
MNGERGFTLVEMLISLAIFAVITAFVTANFRVGQQGDELRISAQLLASSIRRAQTQTIAGQLLDYCHGGTNDLKVCPSGLDDECPGGACSQDLPNGYGVHLSTTEASKRIVIVFADIDGDQAYDAGEEVIRDSISPGPFVFLETLVPASGETLDIVFTPPKPAISFNASEMDTLATMTLRHETTGDTREVSINRISGQVNAD